MSRKRKLDDPDSENCSSLSPPDKSAKLDNAEKVCVLKFIADLESEDNPIHELEKFTRAAEQFASGSTTDDVVQQFLAHTEGDVHLLANLIRKQKSTTLAVAEVYHCLELLFQYVLEHNLHLSTSVVSSMQQPLEQSKRHLEQSLSRSRSKMNHIRAALRMLTALAALGPEGARLVTQVVDFSAAHFRDLLQWRKLKDPEDVRMCAVYLLLSVIATGTNAIVRQILEEKGLVNKTFRGLAFDRAAFICNFLMTFRAKVVRNMAFVKTTKIHIFNENTLTHVLRLMNWQGPKQQKPRDEMKKRSKEPQMDDDEEACAVLQVSQEDIESVQAAAYEFLQEVCCSHKFGIAFRDPSLGLTKNPNITITRLLEDGRKLCESVRGREFLAQVIRACPEQTTYYLHTWMPRLSNAPAPALEKMIGVLQHVVTMQDVVSHVHSLVEKSPTEMCEAVVSLCLLDFVPCITEAQCMKEGNCGLGLHLAHMQFLLASLDKIRSVLQSTSSSSFVALMNTEAREKFKSTLAAAVFQNVPPASDLVSRYLTIARKAESGRQISRSVTEEENPQIHVRGKYCLAILQVLEHYWVCSERSSVDNEECLNWELLLQLVQTSTEALQSDVTESLHLRSLQLVISAVPSLEALFAQGEKSTFHQLLKLLTRGSDRTTVLRASLLAKQILCKVSILEHHSEEMGIWIEKFCLAQPEQHTVLGKLLVAAVNLLVHDPNTYNDKVMHCITETTAHWEHTSVNLQDILQGSIGGTVNAEEPDIFHRRMYFSPLLAAILESLQALKESACRQYVDAVVVEILHMQQYPAALCMFLESCAPRLSSSVMHYSEIWSQRAPKKAAKDTALFEPNAFYGPLVPKLGSIFTKHFFLASKKQKTKSMASGVDMDDVMSAVREVDMPERRSLLCQILFYLRTLFDHEELLPLVPEYLAMLKAVLEPTFNMSDIQEEAVLELFDLLLRHDATFTWYLAVEALNTAYQIPILEYTKLILDTVLLVHQKCSLTTLAKISAPLLQLKGKTVHSMSSGSTIFSNLWGDIVEAFGTVFSEHDKRTLLEAMLAVPKDVPLGAVRTLITQLCNLPSVRQQSEASLSSAAVGNIVALALELDEEDTKSEEEKNEFWNAVLHLFNSHPHYATALEPDCLERLASSESSLELLSVIIEHSPAHQHLLLQMISCQDIQFHSKASPHGIATLLSVLARGLPMQATEPAVGAWIVKQLFRLLKRLCVVEEQVTRQVVSLVADVLTSTLTSKLLGRKNIQKLLDKAIDTPSQSLQLVLLNKISEAATPHLKEPLMDSLLQHLLACLCKAAQGEPPSPPVFQELEHSVNVIMCFDKESFIRVAHRDSLWQTCIVNLLKSAFKSFSLGAAVFKIISAACEKVYLNTTISTHPSADTIYKMILGHSKFLSLMLETDVQAQDARGSLLQLMTTLVKCDNSICCIDHIPAFLCAYGASLSTVDQRILHLLYIYEESGVTVSMFRPCMWGPSAVSFHSIYKKSSRSLLKQPKTEEVLGLFSDGMMASSLLRFPLDLDLQPVIREDVADKSVYDPRFVLPLLHSLLSPGSLLHCRQFVELRCLAYVLHSLCSEVFQVRSLGYNILSLFYQHLEGSRYSISAFWLCVLESLRNGLTATSARLPCLLAGYLANAVHVIHNPAHDAFNPVLNFLLAKPVINISNVPDFYNMFFNQSIRHRFRRSWFLEIVVNNLRSSLDFHICCNRYVLGILQAYFMAPVCNKQSKELVLKILLAAVKIPKATRTLCREQGLLAWVSSALAGNSEDAALTELLFGIVHQVWLSSSVETLTYMDKMAAALKMEHDAISLMAPDHTVKTEVLRGHDIQGPSLSLSAPEATSNTVIADDVRKTHTRRRLYEHFPLEFFLVLCDMCKYIGNCSDLITVTQHVQDMGDVLTYIHTKKTLGISASENVFRPTTQVILSILRAWEQFSASEKSEKLTLLGGGIAQLCVHWLPLSSGSQEVFIRALDIALEHGKCAANDSVLLWLSRLLKCDCVFQVLVSDCGRLNKVVARASDMLTRSDCAPEQNQIIMDVLGVLLNWAAEKTLAEELKPTYRKAVRSLKKKSLSDRQKALATTVLLQELLLKKPKPHLFKTYVNTCVNVE